MKRKNIIILLAILIFASMITNVSAGPLNLKAPDYAVEGEVITIEIHSNGAVGIEGVDVFFILNETTPIHGQTDVEGKVRYQAQLPGRLNIAAKFLGEMVNKEIYIYEANYGVELTLDGAIEEAIYTDEIANYPFLVKNTGNTTDEIEIVIIDGIGSLNRSSFVLNADTSEEVLLRVSKSTAGRYSTTLIASSKEDPRKFDSITVVTEVMNEPSSDAIDNDGANGGGGGGGVALPSEIKTDSRGKVISTFNEESSDGRARLVIPEGTVALDVNKRPLKRVSISPIQLAGTLYACNLGPDGSEFDPAINLTIDFDSDDISKGETVVVKFWDGAEWIALDTTVDIATNTATAKVSHFSVFALFAEDTKESDYLIPDQETEPGTTERSIFEDTKSEESQTSEEETPAIPWTWLLITLLAVAIVVVVVVSIKK